MNLTVGASLLVLFTPGHPVPITGHPEGHKTDGLPDEKLGDSMSILDHVSPPKKDIITELM